MHPIFPSIGDCAAVSWTIARRLLGVLIALGTVASGQTGSQPVGVISYSVGENSTIAIGMPLLRPAVVAGSVAAVNGATLVLAAGTAEQAVSLADGESYYVEVVASASGASAAMVGHRFEVDEVATRAATAGKVVLDLGSPLNTAGAAAVAGLTDYRIVVRPHWTLASLFGSGATAKLNAALSASAADQVLAWDGLGFSVYYLRSGATPQWRNVATGTANQDGAILPPGTGLYLRRRASVLAFSQGLGLASPSSCRCSPSRQIAMRSS